MVQVSFRVLSGAGEVLFGAKIHSTCGCGSTNGYAVLRSVFRLSKPHPAGDKSVT